MTNKITKLEIKELIINEEPISGEFDNQTVIDLDDRNVEFNNCFLDKITINNSKMIKSSFIDMKINNSDWSNLNCDTSTFIRNEYISSKLIGTICSSSYLKDITFENCKMPYFNLSQSKIRNVKFIDCDLSGSSFNYLDFKDLYFQDCNLSEVEFIGTKMHGLDLSSDNIKGIIINKDNLEGLIVNEFQAIEIAKLLGIEIK